MEIPLSNDLTAVAEKVASLHGHETAAAYVLSLVTVALTDVLQKEFMEKIGTLTKYNGDTGQTSAICTHEMIVEMDREGSTFFQPKFHV